MKSNTKSKILIFITFGILFIFSPVINNTLNFNMENDDVLNSDHESLKISLISEPVYIEGGNPNYNWSVAKAAGICTGSGIYSDPYIIEDLVIDGEGVGSCIEIQGSDVFFRIENCTVYNSGYWNSEIYLVGVTNSQLIDNICSNNFRGIHLEYSDNNTISGNIVSNNTWGIYLEDSNDNTLSGNLVNNNEPGIYLSGSNNNNVSGNTANGNSHGIYLDKSNHTIISGNTANGNSYGIILRRSTNNSVSGNTLLENDKCIIEVDCSGNMFSDNGSCTYGEGDGAIPGFNLFFLLAILASVAIFMSKKLFQSIA